MLDVEDQMADVLVYRRNCVSDFLIMFNSFITKKGRSQLQLFNHMSEAWGWFIVPPS